jgi:protein SCO1/2
MRKGLFAVMLASLVSVAGAQVDALSGGVSQKVTDNIGISAKTGSVVPLNTRWKDEYGNEILLRDVVKDRPVILVPIFYNCQSACLLISNEVLDLVKGLKKDGLGRDYDVVSFSIKPTETPENAISKKRDVDNILRTFKRDGKAPIDLKGWHFLTGTQDSITRVTDSVGYRFTFDVKKDRVNHPAGIFILTPDGVLSQTFYGVDYVPKLVFDALNTAKARRLGPELSQKTFFGCLEYDPTTGRNKLVVWRSLQLACIATLLTLGISIAVMSLRNRTNTPAGL